MLRGTSSTRQAARPGEAGAGICLSSRRGPTVGRRLDSRRRRQLGAGERLEFNVGRGGSGSGPGSAEVSTGRRRAACPRPAISGPGTEGALTGPGLTIHSILQIKGLKHAARTRRLRGVYPPLLLPVSLQLGSRHRTPAAGSGSGQLSRSPSLKLDLRVARLGVRPGGAADGNETPDSDAGQAPARASVAGLPISHLISESPGPGVARSGGSWERDIGRLLGSGSVQLRSDSEAR